MNTHEEIRITIWMIRSLMYQLGNQLLEHAERMRNAEYAKRMRNEYSRKNLRSNLRHLPSSGSLRSTNT